MQEIKFETLALIQAEEEKLKENKAQGKVNALDKAFKQAQLKK